MAKRIKTVMEVPYKHDTAIFKLGRIREDEIRKYRRIGQLSTHQWIVIERRKVGKLVWMPPSWFSTKKEAMMHINMRKKGLESIK